MNLNNSLRVICLIINLSTSNIYDAFLFFIAEVSVIFFREKVVQTKSGIKANPSPSITGINVL